MIKTIDQQIGEIVKEWVNRAGVTQKETAEYLGIEQGTISMMLSGKAAFPKDKLAKLAKKFNPPRKDVSKVIGLYFWGTDDPIKVSDNILQNDKVILNDFDRAHLLLSDLVDRDDQAGYMELEWLLGRVRQLVTRSQDGCFSSVRKAACPFEQKQKIGLGDEFLSEKSQAPQDKPCSVQDSKAPLRELPSSNLYMFCAIWNDVVLEFCLRNQLLNQHVSQEVLTKVVDFASQKLFEILQDQRKQSLPESQTFVSPAKPKFYKSNPSSYSFVDDGINIPSLPKNKSQE